MDVDLDGHRAAGAEEVVEVVRHLDHGVEPAVAHRRFAVDRGRQHAPALVLQVGDQGRRVLAALDGEAHPFFRSGLDDAAGERHHDAQQHRAEEGIDQAQEQRTPVTQIVDDLLHEDHPDGVAPNGVAPIGASHVRHPPVRR